MTRGTYGALILSRKRHQSVMIGDNIEVFVADIRGDKVRLGFQAPEQIPIYRREIYTQIQAGAPSRRDRRRQVETENHLP